MKIYSINGTPIIESERLIRIIGFLSAGKYGAEHSKAAALFPFMFVQKKEYATPIFVNHERIHFRQQIELLFIGSLLLNLIEDFYARFFLKLEASDSYLYRATEQEAYINQHNLKYLENRSSYSIFSYLKNKRKITFIEERLPEVTIQ